MKAILSLIAVSIAAVAMAVSASAADEFIPGVTDFPTTGEVDRQYVPGVTDFPSYVPESPSTAQAYVSDGFDWLDAGFGAAIGLALGALAAASLLAMRRRARVSTA